MTQLKNLKKEEKFYQFDFFSLDLNIE